MLNLKKGLIFYTILEYLDYGHHLYYHIYNVSGVSCQTCELSRWTQKPLQNFKPNSLFNP